MLGGPADGRHQLLSGEQPVHHRAAAGTTPVTAVAVPLPGGAVVDGLLTGQQLVSAIGRATEHSPVVVAVVDGRVVGLIRAMDVVAAIRS